MTTPDGQYAELPNALTVTCGTAPSVYSCYPGSGMQGQTISTLNVTGANYQNARHTSWVKDVWLNRTGQPDIIATNIIPVSGNQFRCSVVIPAGAATGKWKLYVRNMDGQIGGRLKVFTVTARPLRSPIVRSVTPKTAQTGKEVFINGIRGSNFKIGLKVTMAIPGGHSIPVSNVTVVSPTRITCDADLTKVPPGYVTVVVTNPDGKKGILSRAFAAR